MAVRFWIAVVVTPGVGALGASINDHTTLRGAHATAETCMDVYGRCLQTRQSLCVSFGVPLHHADCMQAIQAKCWSLAQVNISSRAERLGPWQVQCKECQALSWDGQRLCRKCAHDLDNLNIAAEACTITQR
mmetsp:Transcript_30778/g.71523  ORF Transcript_30778/g.71523 Transcript_30778/m.71523 type:complete len:132 (+) Transcript_30778:41-436(+)